MGCIFQSSVLSLSYFINLFLNKTQQKIQRSELCVNLYWVFVKWEVVIYESEFLEERENEGEDYGGGRREDLCERMKDSWEALR